MAPVRICVYAKDIQKMTGKGQGYARRLIKRIREASGKEMGDQITVSDFCRFTRMKEEEVRPFLVD